MHIGIPKKPETGNPCRSNTGNRQEVHGRQAYCRSGTRGGRRRPISGRGLHAGATLGSAQDALGAGLVLKVRAPSAEELPHMKPGAVVAGMLDPFDAEGLMRLAAAGLTGFALEAAPRHARAEPGRAVVPGQSGRLQGRAAGGALLRPPLSHDDDRRRHAKAARAVVLGAGVAGLQAIATAKRLGAVVEASDVRPAAREQVESLGAKFIDVPFETDEEREIAQGVGGYARPMPPSWMARQAALVSERCKQADIIITTALIPGRPAPTLVSAETVAGMKPGSVLVDLAVERGGNCPLTERGQVVEKHGVTLVGLNNLPGMVATDASALYARNLQDFLKLIINADGALQIQRDDEIVAACLVCEGGNVTRRT